MPLPTRQTPNIGQDLRASFIDRLLCQIWTTPKNRRNLRNGSSKQVNNAETQQKFAFIEERLRVVERIDIGELINANKLSSILELILPSKFKMIEFKKYDGTRCPTAISPCFTKRWHATPKMTNYWSTISKTIWNDRHLSGITCWIRVIFGHWGTSGGLSWPNISTWLSIFSQLFSVKSITRILV